MTNFPNNRFIYCRRLGMLNENMTQHSGYIGQYNDEIYTSPEWMAINRYFGFHKLVYIHNDEEYP